ncbi:hypothetical protein [Nonomuraea deserti]|nr:hypothetical protein [Nonomuraea deserti]
MARMRSALLDGTNATDIRAEFERLAAELETHLDCEEEQIVAALNAW